MLYSLEIITTDTFINTGIFIIICLLGVIARLSYDIEKNNRKFKISTFFNRLFLTILFAYVIEIFIIKSDKIREYYTQIMLLFSFFFIDILDFIMKNKNKLVLYMLTICTQCITDLKNMMNKK